MRITAGVLAILLTLGSSIVAVADDEPTNFEARWPKTPMRQPTLTEMVRLVAAVKGDVKPAIGAELSSRWQTSLRCPGDFCRMVDPR